MTDTERREAARQFYNRWVGKGDEKSDCQRFWIDLCENVLDIDNITERLTFEKRVIVNDTTKFIDVYIAETKVLIEQKSYTKRLDEKLPFSTGDKLTAYEQGRLYGQWLTPDETPLWIIACNFKEFEIHNMNTPNEEPVRIALDEIIGKYSLFDFMFKKEIKAISKELDVSIKAGNLVGKLYDALHKMYADPDSDETLRALNILCVRLVFCMYAEDAGIFGVNNLFYNYLSRYEPRQMRNALLKLFDILNTKQEDRDKYLAQDDEILASFPYVNGGLFAGEAIEIPPFTEEIKDILLEEASNSFNWSLISPTIFGAVFESTLNPETRRKGGMHYTSIENIHKVIDPLFLNDLKAELESISEVKTIPTKKRKLEEYREKLASLTFLDPACGSGNFLTETYISIRRLENRALRMEIDTEDIGAGRKRELNTPGQSQWGFDTEESEVYKHPIKVGIGQFYGIEINDFAVTVAKTALWIAESQMIKETESIIYQTIDFLPLRTNAYIKEGNALRTDWNSVVNKSEVDYIMGNPPFVGARLMSAEQKEDVSNIFQGYKNIGNLDYVCCWYKKATNFMQGTDMRASLVSTNSICQGESVSLLWKPLFDEGVHIDYAYTTFTWDSEASVKAHVYCVIVGFSIANSDKPKLIYTGDNVIEAKNINGYLVDGDNVFVDKTKKPICDVPEIGIGNMPIDDGNYLFTREEMEEFIKKEPKSKAYFKLWYGSQEFINQKPRYCLYLGECTPSELRSMPECMKRVQAVKEFRESSKREITKKLAYIPTEFGTTNIPKSTYILIPRVSSERRRYIPMGFLDSISLASDSVHIIPNATIFHFGVLTSNIHMAWVRAVCGRLKSDYRYSKDIVYNNFPWPECTEFYAEIVNNRYLDENGEVHIFGEDISATAQDMGKASSSDDKIKSSNISNIVPDNARSIKTIDDLLTADDIKNFSPKQKEYLEQIHLIEKYAQGILDARASYSDSTFADLYDEITMPPDLRKAHRLNDKAVMKAYGFDIGMTESEAVAELFRLYEECEKYVI